MVSASPEMSVNISVDVASSSVLSIAVASSSVDSCRTGGVKPVRRVVSIVVACCSVASMEVASISVASTLFYPHPVFVFFFGGLFSVHLTVNSWDNPC